MQIFYSDFLAAIHLTGKNVHQFYHEFCLEWLGKRMKGARAGLLQLVWYYWLL